MGQFQKGNAGRPVGAKNKQPKREALVQLLDSITTDLEENYHKLSINQKIKLLQCFKGFYDEPALSAEEIEHFRTITVTIIGSKNGDTEL